MDNLLNATATDITIEEDTHDPSKTGPTGTFNKQSNPKRQDMLSHHSLTDQDVWHAIRHGLIRYGGHRGAHIYGRLTCAAGKRMRKSMRVFFSSKKEALLHGFRPCGHCMPDAFRQWYENKHNQTSMAEQSRNQTKGHPRARICEEM